MRDSIGERPCLADRASYLLSRARGVPIESDLRPYLGLLGRIRQFDLSAQSDEALGSRAAELGRRVAVGERLDELLPPVYALVAEASRRALGLSPYDVQIVAAVALHQGKLAQMQNGEGKTLAAVFPAALNALSGRGVHIMTANDYLARRDAEWMGSVYRTLGLRVGFVGERMGIRERRAAYAADVTYVTAREVGFDLLRDSLRYDRNRLVHRPFHFAIVDEADFILIDEARVPLVIAGSAAPPEFEPLRIDEAVRSLRAGVDFRIDRRGRSVHLTLEGQGRVQELLGCGGMHEEGSLLLFAAVAVALRAHHLLRRDVDYIVRRRRVELVDELTGRVADRRRWPYGIQSALEAKEGLGIRPEGTMLGSITIQHLLRLYPRLSGLTATAVPAAAELARSYELATVVIPPNRPVRRHDAPDRVFRTREAKMAAIVEEIGRVHSSGRPVLVGTASVNESEALADRLRRRGIRCQILNARNHRREAALVARAGMLRAVTISTNMAGRGTDIKLGGEEGAERGRIAELGGLYVLGTSRQESARVDHQLRGRAGRQGDPGTSSFFVSLEDELVERYAVLELIPPRRVRRDRGELVSDPRVSREIRRAQGMIETQHLEMRRALTFYSEIVERQRVHLQGLRSRALVARILPDELAERCGSRCRDLAQRVGDGRAHDLLVRSYLHCLDGFWADHLLYVDELREGVHLQRIGGRDPLLHFLRNADDSFVAGLGVVVDRAADLFGRILDRGGEGDGVEATLRGPSGTWTYVAQADPLPDFRIDRASLARAGLAVAAAAVAAVPLLVAAPFAAIASLLRTICSPRRGDPARRRRLR